MHTKKAVVRRLILCQGSAQLLTAVSVLKRRDDEAVEFDNIHFQNYLIVFGLAVSAKQNAAFYHEISRIARAIYNFKSIKYMPDEIMVEFATISTKIALEEHITGFLGMASIDEIYAARDWQPANQHILSAYDSALKICYGDGFGYYFKEKHHSIASKIKAICRKKIKFDASYLMMPNDFDAVNSKKVYKTTGLYLNCIYNTLAEIVEKNQLTDFLKKYRGRRIAVILTSNFSEQKLMTLDAEIEAYKEYILNTQLEKYDAILIKSHPRDSLDKSLFLKQALHDLSINIIDVNKIFSAYLPFEVFFNIIKNECTIKVFTFSSSFLPLKYICNADIDYGFGDVAIKKYFLSNKAKSRIREEKTFKKILKA